MKRYLSEIHPFSKLGMISLVALLSLLVFWILSFVLVIPIFGKEAFSQLIASGMQMGEEQAGLLKFLQLAQSIGLFIVPSLILAVLFGGKIAEYLLLYRKPLLWSTVLAVTIVFVASPMINVVGLWNASMSLPPWMSGIEQWMRQSEDAAKQLTDLFVKADSLQGLFFNIFLIGIIPAIGEELLFRGIIQRVFTEWTRNKHAAIWITAILFSALHLQFYGFFPRAILGAMFGYLLIWSNNLWLPVIAHFINNTVAVIAYYLYHKGSIQTDPDTLGTQSEYGLAAILSLICLVALYFVYYRYSKQRLEEI